MQDDLRFANRALPTLNTEKALATALRSPDRPPVREGLPAFAARSA